MKNTIRICGIDFEIIEVDAIDEEVEGITMGKILLSQGKILLRKEMPDDVKIAVLYHEVLHGILDNLGYKELCENENFVQCLSNTLFQMFKFREGVIKVKEHEEITKDPTSHDFLNFLYNTINPNEMEQYIRMYQAGDIPTNGE